MRVEKLTKHSFEVPLRARNTAKEIEAERAVLGKGVAREMGFREEAKAGDSSGPGKLMPLGFAHGAELHLPNDVVK